MNLAILIATTAIVQTQPLQNEVGAAAREGYGYSLTESQISLLSTQAMAGSAEAADRLGNFYWMRGIPDRENTMRWAQIGAENGDPESEFRMYQLLQNSADTRNQLRALFWLKRAAADNYLGAKAILAECPDITTKGAPPNSHCFGPDAD